MGQQQTTVIRKGELLSIGRKEDSVEGEGRKLQDVPGRRLESTQ